MCVTLGEIIVASQSSTLVCNTGELSRAKHNKVRLLISATFLVLDLPQSIQNQVVKFDWLHRNVIAYNAKFHWIIIAGAFPVRFYFSISFAQITYLHGEKNN